MKLLLEIKAIFGYGVGYKKITHEIEVKPKFKLKRTKIDSLKVPTDLKEVFHTEYGEFITTSRKVQYDDYLSDDSNGIIRNLMDDLDIHAIEDWKILRVGEARKKKTNTGLTKTKADKNKSKVHELVIELRDCGYISEELKDEFMAFYIEMYDNVKHLSPDDQIKITMGALGAGAKAATQAYKNMIQYSNDLKDKSLKELNAMKEDREKKKLLNGNNDEK